MAIANFFDRTLLSAAQALQGFDPQEIRTRLEGLAVELAFDGAAATRAEGRAALDMAARLLARLYPTLRLTPLDTAAAAHGGVLSGLARAINPSIDFAKTGRSGATLVFGDTVVRRRNPVIYAGSDGWLGKASEHGPQGVGETDLPYGAGAGACLGAANVFRALFADALPNPRLDSDAVLSIFDFSTGAAATQGPATTSVDLGGAPLVGLGAIGNGVIWALARDPGPVGVVHLVDHEAVELTNLQRYILSTQADLGRVKVEVARAALLAGASRLEPLTFLTRWDDYVVGRGHPSFDRVVVGLDSAADRIAVQAALPRRVLNAWTQAGDLGVSRHDFLGEDACLACLYMPTQAAPNRDEEIATALALPLEQPILLDIRERLVNGQPVGESFVRQAAERLGVGPELLLPFAQEPLNQFYAKAVCGGQVLRPTARPPVEAPLAFQSAMAGVLLAADFVVESGGLRQVAPPTKTTLDLTRPLGRRLGVRIRKVDAAAPARCLCQDVDFRAAYERRYGATKPDEA